MAMHPAPLERARGSWARQAVVTGVFVVLALLSAWLGAGGFSVYDMETWIHDAPLVERCATAPTSDCAGVSKFPVAYLANSALLQGAGPAQSHARMTGLNLFVLLLPVFAVLRLHGWRRGLAPAIVYLGAIALTPLPMFYLRSGALEVQAGVVIGMFIGLLGIGLRATAPLTRGQVALIALTGAWSVLYKDTVVLSVGLSVLAVAGFWRARQRVQAESASAQRRDGVRLALIAAGAGVAVGLCVVLGYNLLRYHSLLPLAYLEEARQTQPSWGTSAGFLVGSVLSPNGGVLVFWTLGLTAAFVGWRVLGLRADRDTLAIAVLAALISLIGFARWWAPFGWSSWGNRLMIQPMLAVLVAGLLALRPVSVATDRRMAWVVLALAPTLLWSAYYVSLPYLAARADMIGETMWPAQQCERMKQAMQEPASQQLGLSFWRSDTYYSCATERMLYVPRP
ncbi:hypothetical protein [Xanthomonas sacchari]|uniref:hypothetical protein n=1 Tax=Xanthomonas sacchari TaxID=56458 RepID=UPI0020C2ED76|nr:hypothetical protein [Xanthomonas sacchari]